MYINHTGNVIADCIVVGKPRYLEEFGVYKRELTQVNGHCKENSPDGVQTVNLVLYFFSAFAIPAMKLKPGTSVVFVGREISNEFMSRGKYVLERKVVVDWWFPREIDPMGMLEELKTRMEIKAREQEFKEIFWSWLNMDAVKELIIGWFVEWLREQRKPKEESTAKPEQKRNSNT